MNRTRKAILPFVIKKFPRENSIAYQKKGHWTEKEKLKYAIFLQHFKEKFTSKDNKKRYCKIFKVMSDFIKTRTHNQCRSHHQKMEQQRYQVDGIIRNVSQRYHPRVYKEWTDRYLVEIEQLSVDEREKQSFDRQEKKEMKKCNKLQLKSDQKEKRVNLRQEHKKNKNKEKIKINTEIQINLRQDQESFRFQKIDFQKKELRPTRQCQEDQDQNSQSCRQMIKQFTPPAFQQIFNRQMFSIVCAETFQLMKNSNYISYPGIIQSLQMRKIQCLNKATFHYNEMQIELNNAEQCQKVRTLLINNRSQDESRKDFEKSFFLNNKWNFSNYNQPF